MILKAILELLSNLFMNIACHMYKVFIVCASHTSMLLVNDAN